MLLAVGLWEWMPSIDELASTKERLQQAKDELAIRLEGGNRRPREVNQQLSEEANKRRRTEKMLQKESMSAVTLLSRRFQI
ncbi:MAG: hypothetical protein R3C68_10275 [Myxococcota bacterium]